MASVASVARRALYARRGVSVKYAVARASRIPDPLLGTIVLVAGYRPLDTGRARQDEHERTV